MSDNGNGTVRYRVVSHPGADADLAAIVYHIEVVNDRPLDALRSEADFRRHAARLTTFPGGYTKASNGPPRPAHFTTFKKTYLVYHEVFEAEKVVRLLYVWHGRRGTRPDLVRQDDPLVQS